MIGLSDISTGWGLKTSSTSSNVSVPSPSVAVSCPPDASMLELADSFSELMAIFARFTGFICPEEDDCELPGVGDGG